MISGNFFDGLQTIKAEMIASEAGFQSSEAFLREQARIERDMRTRNAQRALRNCGLDVYGKPMNRKAARRAMRRVA